MIECLTIGGWSHNTGGEVEFYELEIAPITGVQSGKTVAHDNPISTTSTALVCVVVDTQANIDAIHADARFAVVWGGDKDKTQNPDTVEVTALRAYLVGRGFDTAAVDAAVVTTRSRELNGNAIRDDLLGL